MTCKGYDSPVGCFLEVDLDYLNDLHNLHNDYPLAGEKIKLTEEMLSKFQLQIIGDNNLSLCENKKLIPILANKNTNTTDKKYHPNLKL